MAKTKLADWSRACTELKDVSHIWQLDYVTLVCGELGGFRRGKHSAALFHNPYQDVRMAAHGDDFVCLSDDDGPRHIDSLLKSKYTAKDMGTLKFEDSDVTSLLLLNRVFRVGVRQTGQYLDMNLIGDTLHSSSVNQDAIRTLKR